MAPPTQQPTDLEHEINSATPANAQVGSPHSPSLIARASIIRDIQEERSYGSPEDAVPSSENSNGKATVARAWPPNPPDTLRHLMAASSHGSNFISSVPGPLIVPVLHTPEPLGYRPKAERDAVRREEQSPLIDDHIISIGPSQIHTAPPKSPAWETGNTTLAAQTGREARDAEAEDQRGSPPGHTTTGQTERSLLLPTKHSPSHGADSEEDIYLKLDEAAAAVNIHTSWRREAQVLARYSPSLIVTFLLQYSLTMASVFTVGHLGTVELAAASLGSTTAVITGYVAYQGLATSLDTLCAQAYGSGKRELVGLQMQRMVLFLWCITIPIGVVWLSSRAILHSIVPDAEVANLAGLYLKVLLLGAPGYAAFEAGKRYLQAQGLFTANLYVLLFCAPLNAFMNWLFVWHFKYGFVGAPIAIVITDNLLPLCLFLYVRFVDGGECWGGIDKRAIKNWGPMIQLAIPGFLMVFAEYLGFEVLTLAASWISTSHLAAQSLVATITCTAYQIPYPVSIAASTRIANLIGAALPVPAKTAAKVATVVAVFIGLLNMTLLVTLRDRLPRLFTTDEDVIRLVFNVLPVCAAFQLFDALVANCNGILRGIGRQRIGGIVGLFCYYAIGMPVSFGAGFGLHWDLKGLWAGPAVALALVAAIEGWYIYTTSWERAVDEATKRNNMG